MKFFPSTSASTRRMAFSAVFASILIAGCGGGGGSSDNSIKPTKAMYDQIQLGMTYSQAVAVVGGEAIPLNGFGAQNTRTWNGGTSSNSNLIICFPNNAASYKLYRGSETGGPSSKGLEAGDKATCV
jgi:hypothetical protein